MNTSIAITVVILCWILLKSKTSRPDGKLLKNVHPYRYLLPFVMRTRNESAVYFDCPVRAKKLLALISKNDTTITHYLVYAAARALRTYPDMNCFVSGRRIYQRDHIDVSFSMKRVKLDKKSKLAVVKLSIPEASSFSDIQKLINQEISIERSDKKTYADKEFALFSTIPAFLFDIVASIFVWLDFHNLLPGSFLKNDGLFTSAFIANLGSLKMGAGYHHLYEWGNCPLFIMAGQVEERVIVVDGEMVIEPILPLRFSFDERVNDGLSAKYAIDLLRETLENPETLSTQR